MGAAEFLGGGYLYPTPGPYLRPGVRVCQVRVYLVPSVDTPFSILHREPSSHPFPRPSNIEPRRTRGTFHLYRRSELS